MYYNKTGCGLSSGFVAGRKNLEGKMYRVIRSVLIFSLVAVFVGCEYWNKDMLGYLEYWSETVQMGKVEVSDAAIQKNDAGADTIPVAATPTIAAYVINPQSYELLAEIGDSSSADKSVRVSDSAVQSKAQVVAHEATLLKVQLGSADGSLEHTEFRVDFEAIRKDTMQSSGKVIGVTLRYNTPPVAPIPLVKTEGGYTPPPVGDVWEADRDGTLYWAYDDSITEETDPNCAKWFSINGTRHLVAGCKVELNEQVDGLSVFQFNTNYGGTSVAAVDSEGVSSPAVASGQAVPPATYVIKYDANGADGGTAPTSQSKTQYTDITLATNSGGLTRIGYRFTGWNTNKEGTGTTYPAGATYSDDAGVTLYAKWEVVNTVTFSKSGAVDHGDSVTLTPPAGATIYYRVQEKDEQQGAQGQPVMVTLYNASHSPSSATGVAAGIPEGGNVTITAYAKYADGAQSEETTGTYTLKQYTVSYVGNGNTGGTEPSQQTFYSGGSVAVQGGDYLKKTGYTFAGWNTKAGGTGTPYREDDSYTDDASVTLTAQWDPNTYTVRFDPNGGSYSAANLPTQEFTYDVEKKLDWNRFTPPTTGHEFVGWKDDDGNVYTDEEEVSNLTDIADGTVILYAQWKIAVITLDASTISSADDLRTVLANYSNCKITVNLGGKQLEVTSSDLATNTEFFTVKDGNKVTITNGTVAVTGDFSSVSGDFFLFSVKTGSTLDLSGCTLTGTNFGNAEGTAVEVSDGGSLTLTNTTISNFESNGQGAGVRVISGGSAIMNSGAIKNNTARYGAAVYLTGSFTMNGGEISGNTNVNGSSISGSGTFKWNGGTISNNKNGSAEGGSVFDFEINYRGTMDKNAAL